jgi:hypothetical protein
MNGIFIIEEKFLDRETKDLFFDLERLTRIPAAKFMANLATGKDNLEDLKLTRELLLKREKYPIEQMLAEHKYYTSEEVGKKLGFI